MEEKTFWLEYEQDHFVLRGENSLAVAQRSYLQQYLERVNSYQTIGKFGSSPVFSLYQPPLASAAGARSLGMRLRRRFQNERIPATATIAINKACQCECEHCSATFYNHSSKPVVSTIVLKQAIRESVSLGVTEIILLGGEPLLHQDLPELVAAVPPEKAVVTLFTNGEFLTSPRCRALAQAGLMGVFVSLDSPREEEHDHLRRRPGLFGKALQGVRHLQQEGILVAISTYLSPERLERGIFQDMMELAKDLKVNEVTFFDAIPSGHWLKSSTCLLKPQHREMIRSLVRANRKTGNYPGISAQSTLTSKEGSAFCFAANTQFYLTAHGEMCPCDFTPLTVGRFPKESISTLWERMIRTPPYHCRAKSCRMQDEDFRRKYLDHLPLNTKFPKYLSSHSLR